jgi:Tol biopolymer transport system component
MSGDWEIFRLGDLPDGVEADPNLSRGVGSRVYDLMPSRSPDQKWIAFTSNRDGNWEIYLSAVERPYIQRLSYNTTAIDLDPAWSPTDGRIAYESNRSGDWQLYLFDVGTGEETRLTESEGNNVNAFWSYDGRKIVFQSDREGFWQLYEIDTTTRQERLLSDGAGDDHDPQYSNDDQHILFRSMRDGDNSVIYVMKADGSEVTRISDVGGYALNEAWSPDDSLIAYQSDMDGDEDVYVYEVATGQTRQLTDNTLQDYAPTWYCTAPVLVFTSDVTGDSNLFSTTALPVDGPAIDVEREASQLTTSADSDEYPLDSPSEENASREESFPSPIKNK